MHARRFLRPRPFLRLAVVVAVLTVVVAGCGDDDDTEADAGTTTTVAAPATTAAASPEAGVPDDAVDLTGQTAVTVSVTDNRFTERAIVVSAGTEITWVNEGRNDHNVTPDEDGAFEAVATDDLTPGLSASRVFDEPGVYPYHCTLHGAPGRGQYGTVVVA